MFRRFALILATACAATPLSAQQTPAELAVAAGAAPAPQGWKAPHTAWGDPDLRGTWPLEFLATRPERPANLGTKRYWTDDEYKKLLAAGPGFGGSYEKEAAANEIGSGHWTEAGHPLKLTSLIVEPANGRYPPLTAEGKARQAQMHSSWTQNTFDSIVDFNSLDRCISRGMPASMIPFPYNNGLRIFQAPGYVVLNLELIHETRIIPLDGRPASAGRSRAGWAIRAATGKARPLVVETTNFNGMIADGPRWAEQRAGCRPARDSMSTERFTPTGPTRSSTKRTVDDPVVLTGPFTIAFPWTRNDNYKIFEYACHEGNTIVHNYIHATSPRFAAQRAAALAAKRRPRSASPAPLAPFLGLAQHFVGEAIGLELPGRVLVLRPDVGMDFLGLGPPGFLDRLEVGVGFEPEQLERAHLVGAAAAVAGAAPAVMSRLGIAGVGPLLGPLARFGLLLVEAFEIIPLAIVFGRVTLAEVPAIGAVGRFRSGAIARLLAAVAIAQAHASSPRATRRSRASAGSPNRPTGADGS